MQGLALYLHGAELLRWIIATVVGLAAVAGVIAYRRAHSVKAPRFVTTPAERGPIVARVTASGTLSALVTVQVGSQVSGRIKELHATFNSPVKKGQVHRASIDPQLFDAALEQAQANVPRAQGELWPSQGAGRGRRAQSARATRAAPSRT